MKRPRILSLLRRNSRFQTMKFYCSHLTCCRRHHIKESVAGINFFEIQEEQLLTSPMAQEKGRKERFRKRFTDGHKCYGFISKDIVVAYFWLSAPRTTVPFIFSLSVTVPDDAYYIWDCRTAPEYRRKGLYTRGLLNLYKHAVQHDAQRLLIMCQASNTASQRGIEAAGFLHISSFWAISLFSWLTVAPKLGWPGIFWPGGRGVMPCSPLLSGYTISTNETQ